jgi:dipeptidase E
MKLLLTSLGLCNDDIASALATLAGKPLSELSILFVPTAANTEGEDKSWLIGNLVDFQKRNFKSIDILDIAAVDESIWKRRFLEKDIICFGGGNEKYLAEVFEKLGMKEFLKTLDDKIYMGISAGSMVAGKFMPDETYSLIFPEENFAGMNNVRPMELYDFCFIPHLNSSYFNHIRKEILEDVKSKFNTSVYATDDETAITIAGSKLQIVGKGDYWEHSK